ncbi:MAG: lactonase family protein [Thiomonas sp.]
MHTKPQFAYVVNWGNVSAYRIHASTGALTEVPGSPFAAGSLPDSVTVNPAGTFAYVVSQYSDSGSNHGSVSVYRIHASTGTLTPIPGSPFAAGPYPSSFAINPAGTFAYVPSGIPGMGSGAISAYRINASTGALTDVPGSPFAAGTLPSSITVNPAGTFAYVTSWDIVSAYRIDTSTGALTPVPGSPFEAGSLPESVRVSPAGTFVYVASAYGDPGAVFVYRIHAATGALTEIPGSPFTTGIEPRSITVNPAGTLAYVANQGNFGSHGSISAYRIDAATGALTPVAGSPFMTGTRPDSITIVQPQ